VPIPRGADSCNDPNWIGFSINVPVVSVLDFCG
jgi:hypothetical protein